MLREWVTFQSTEGQRPSRMVVSWCIAQVADAVIDTSLASCSLEYRLFILTWVPQQL
jgi:hypothetical protein